MREEDAGVGTVGVVVVLALHPRLEYWELIPHESPKGERQLPPLAHTARLVAEVGRALINAVVEAATATPGVVVEGEVEESTRAPYTRTRGSDMDTPWPPLAM